MLFTSLGLSDPILKAITETGYTKPTPIQAKAIPLVLEGRDVLAAAKLVLVKQLVLRCHFWSVWFKAIKRQEPIKGNQDDMFVR